MSKLLDILASQTASELSLPLDLVEALILHKHKALHENLYHCNTLEDSGLGKYKFRDYTAKNRITKLTRFITSYNRQLEALDPLSPATPSKTITLNKRIATAQDEIDYLQAKLDKC